MALTIDMSDDYLIWDNPETVRLESVRRGARSVQVATGRPFDPDTRKETAMPEVALVAKRRALTQRELAASGGVYTGQDLVFLIPAAQLTPDTTIKPGDAVVDQDGGRHTVLDLQLGKWRQTWRLTTRNLVLSHDLRDLIDVQRADLSFDSSGVAVKTFPPQGGKTLYANLPARVQPQTEEIVDERGIRGEQIRFDVVIGRQVDLNVFEDRILWDGKILDVVTTESSEQITDLPTLKCLLKV